MYTPTNWQDHIVEKPHRFEMTNGESPGMVYLNPAPGEVDQQGTPQNAQNFNHMEKGIAEVTAAMDRLMAEAQKEFDTLKKISDELKKKADKNGGITVANSLQVAALAGGAAIAEDTDLDTLTVPGTYAAASAAVAATLLHCPISGSGFVMYTFLTYPYNRSTTYRTQIIICGGDTPSSFWIRNFNGSGKWCDWVRMKYTDTTYSNATTTVAGLMSASDKTQLSNMPIVCYQGSPDGSSITKALPAGKTKCLIIMHWGSSSGINCGAYILTGLSSNMTAVTTQSTLLGSGAVHLLYTVTSAGTLTLYPTPNTNCNYTMIYFA